MCLLTFFARFDHWKWPKLAKMSKNSGSFRNIGIYELVNTPWNRGAVGAFSCFTNTSLLPIFLIDYSQGNQGIRKIRELQNPVFKSGKTGKKNKPFWRNSGNFMFRNEENLYFFLLFCYDFSLKKNCSRFRRSHTKFCKDVFLIVAGAVGTRILTL